MDHVFFHGDVDGIISAAIFMNKTNKMNTDKYILHPMLSSSRGEKFKNAIKLVSRDGNFIYVFDFQYSDKSVLWIDHHQNDLMGYEPILNNKICFDHRSPSAAGLVCRYLEEVRKYDMNDENIKYLVEAADMIDSANYPDVGFIFNDKSPAMILRAYLERAFPSEMMFCRIVEILAKYNLDLKTAIKVMNINETAVESIKLQAETIKERLVLANENKISIIHQKYPYQYPRYSENYVSNAKYNIRISSGDKTIFYVQIGHSRWHGTPNNINLGKYIINSRFFIKGGGHFNVASGSIKKKDQEDFLNEFSELVENENGGEGVEKYGVDKNNDSFEKKAEDLVKTGQAKNIDEAREEVEKQKPTEEPAVDESKSNEQLQH